MRPHHYLLAPLLAAALPITVGVGVTQCPQPVTRARVTLPGLSAPVLVSTDARGVPHVEAETLADAVRTQGYLHARDRFFQMDVTRRQAEGTLAELLGDINAVGSDLQLRDLGLRRAAERSAALLTSEERALLEAYAEGVNAWLATNPLPAPYARFEISVVRPWDLLDSLACGKFQAFVVTSTLSGKTGDLDFARNYQDYVTKGQAASPPFDGAKLVDDDVTRLAPMDGAATLPDAGVPPPFLPGTSQGSAHASAQSRVAVSGLAPQLDSGQAAASASGLGGHDSPLQAGSNAWVVAGEHTDTGTPLLAGDAHLQLVAPAQFYELQLAVRPRAGEEELNLGGETLPGFPLVLFGRSQHVAWSFTSGTSDVQDTFVDHLVRGDPGCRDQQGLTVPLCIRSEGALHPVERRQEQIRLNLLGDNVLDDSVPITALDVLTVPFRGFGLIIEVEDRTILEDGPPAETTALTLQWTGFLGGREIGAALGWARAHDVPEFLSASRLFTAIFFNALAADVTGNIGYRLTGEIPLRADLEAGAPVGGRPDLVSDGSGPSNWVRDEAHSQGQVLPYAVIPADEMPQAVNPPAGFLVSANNDATGAILDNDPFNQFRRSNPHAVYYVGWGGSPGLRAGRITRLLREAIDSGQRLTVDDMKGIQANTQILDAELMLPFLLEAWSHVQDPAAPAELRNLVAGDARLAPAIARLAAWDFSTPTGIPEGWDASDVDGVRNPVVTPQEAAASVAATIYAAWRDAVRDATISKALRDRALHISQGIYGWAAFQHLLTQQPFTGVGASGVDFFPDPVGLTAAERRDFVLLNALATALDQLAGPAYAAAFNGSTNLDDYRWGKLHRLTMPSVLSNGSIPPAGGFESLAPNLLGLARDGAFEAVNAGGLPFIGSGSDAFAFTWAPMFRLVFAPGHPDARPDGVLGFSSLAGGPSGDPTNPLYVSQLGKWLTVDYDRMLVNARDVRAAAMRVELFAAPIAPAP